MKNNEKKLRQLRQTRDPTRPDPRMDGPDPCPSLAEITLNYSFSVCTITKSQILKAIDPS